MLSVDWHPNRSTILASGGRDRYVKIWDLSDMDMKQQQPQQTIQTIASVGRVAWRPNCSDQIATSASLMDNNIHLWDTQRPCIPLASMNGHSDIASGILWLDTPASSDSSQVTEGKTSLLDASSLRFAIWTQMQEAYTIGSTCWLARKMAHSSFTRSLTASNRIRAFRR